MSQEFAEDRYSHMQYRRCAARLSAGMESPRYLSVNNPDANGQKGMQPVPARSN